MPSALGAETRQEKYGFTFDPLTAKGNVYYYHETPIYQQRRNSADVGILNLLILQPPFEAENLKTYGVYNPGFPTASGALVSSGCNIISGGQRTGAYNWPESNYSARTALPRAQSVVPHP